MSRLISSGSPHGKGGYSLVPPETFLYWQHSTALVNYVQDLICLPQVLHTGFSPFANSLGMVLNPLTLPYFQMGSNVIWDTMPYLGWSAHTFSIVKKDIQFEEPDMLSHDTPLWHSTMFINRHKQSYFVPRLIRQGILTVGQLLEDDTLFALVAPTWLSIDKDHISNHCSRHSLSRPDPPTTVVPRLELAF